MRALSKASLRCYRNWLRSRHQVGWIARSSLFPILSAVNAQNAVNFNRRAKTNSSHFARLHLQGGITNHLIWQNPNAKKALGRQQRFPTYILHRHSRAHEHRDRDRGRRNARYESRGTIRLYVTKFVVAHINWRDIRALHHDHRNSRAVNAASSLHVK